MGGNDYGCMYLSSVDTSTNWPPDLRRVSKQFAPSTKKRREQSKIRRRQYSLEGLSSHGRFFSKEPIWKLRKISTSQNMHNFLNFFRTTMKQPLLKSLLHGLSESFIVLLNLVYLKPNLP